MTECATPGTFLQYPGHPRLYFVITSKNAMKRQLGWEAVVLFCFIQATQGLVLLANVHIHNLRIISFLSLTMCNHKIVGNIPPCRIVRSAETITFLVECRLSEIMLMVNAAKIPHRIYKSFKQFYLGYFHFIILALWSIWLKTSLWKPERNVGITRKNLNAWTKDKNSSSPTDP